MPTAAGLDPRKSSILRAVVAGYIRTAEPVGSGAIARRYRLGVSPATIRNELSVLEEMGYLSHPHTSAGRIPTDRGYRFYVDTLPRRPALSETHRRAIASFFGELQPDVEEMLRRTASLLSRVTRYAAIAVAPVPGSTTVARADVVEVGGGWLLLLIGDTGRVDKRVLDIPREVHAAVVRRAGRALTQAVGGRSFAEARSRVERLGVTAGDERPVFEAAARALCDLEERETPDHVFLGGAANIAGEGAFERRETVRRLFEALEQQEALHHFLRAASREGDVAVRIGHEHPLAAMREASTVVAPYRAGGRPAGTVAVIGPTRMAYPTAISVVDTVARRLSRLIESRAE
ncbi:MAG TPA: heat-inducible transcriptional repressor HrcA [Actinomycetota bacterium]|nr:heat-inducible transcriptional repressor HrcA [Actinomycetota bacterium]